MHALGTSDPPPHYSIPRSFAAGVRHRQRSGPHGLLLPYLDLYPQTRRSLHVLLSDRTENLLCTEVG